MLFFQNWDSSFIVSVLRDTVGYVGTGLLLAACVWIVGFVLIRLFDFLKGGF